MIAPAVHGFLGQAEKREGVQLLIQQKLLKFAGTSSALVRRAIAKYNKYPEKKKRHLAKLGLKTVFKLARVVFAAKGGAPDATVAEVLFEECQKRFGHNKLSAKAFKQFLASAHYHAGAHPKIALLCAFLGIGEKPFSSEVAGFYAEVLTALAESKVGMPIEYDERQERELVHFGRCSEVLREALEPGLPAEVVQDLRQRLAHLQERHAKALAQQVVDLDKFMDFMVRALLKFRVDLFDKAQIVYHAWTLYERDYLSGNEVWLTLEVLGGDPLRMVSELSEHVFVQKRDLLKIFEETCLVDDLVAVRKAQFCAVMRGSDLFATRRARELFGQLPFRHSIAKFQELFALRAATLKQ